jgi:hypothetical protein
MQLIALSFVWTLFTKPLEVTDLRPTDHIVLALIHGLILGLPSAESKP